MQRAIIVRGRLVGSRRIDPDEALEDVSGDVEVVVRSIEPTNAVPKSRLLDVIRGLPAGTRTKEDIDAQLAEERSSWGDR
ncbi:MAG: hypothetical protein V9G14_15475 [Cypionkella sp.]